MLHGWHLHGRRAFWSITRACQKEPYAAMSATDLLFDFIMCVRKVCALLFAASDLGDNAMKHISNWFSSRLRFNCLPRDMAHDLLHSHLSAGHECFTSSSYLMY